MRPDDAALRRETWWCDVGFSVVVEAGDGRHNDEAAPKHKTEVPQSIVSAGMTRAAGFCTG
jgi:hypothetical protein